MSEYFKRVRISCKGLSRHALQYFTKSSPLIASLPSIDISSNLSLAPSHLSLSLSSDFSPFLIPQLDSILKASIVHLRRIIQLKVFLDNPTVKLLLFPLILFKLLYALLRGHATPSHLNSNSTARLVSGTHKFSRPTLTLISLHWLILNKIIFRNLHYYFLNKI